MVEDASCFVTYNPRSNGDLMQWFIEVIVEQGFQTVGWAVLKVVTFGRYQGYTEEDRLPEGALGFAVVLAVAYGIYRWI